jgi:hypothetical protein
MNSQLPTLELRIKKLEQKLRRTNTLVTMIVILIISLLIEYYNDPYSYNNFAGKYNLPQFVEPLLRVYDVGETETTMINPRYHKRIRWSPEENCWHILNINGSCITDQIFLINETSYTYEATIDAEYFDIGSDCQSLSPVGMFERVLMRTGCTLFIDPPKAGESMFILEFVPYSQVLKDKVTK